MGAAPVEGRAPQGDNASVGLRAYLDGIASVVKRLPSAWVRCELHGLKVGDRFTRMEFIELDEHGKQIAKVSGGCWPGVWQRISAAFAAAGLPIEAGSQVLVKLDADLSATFGFQVSVSDMSVEYALGDLNSRMQAIRRALQESGKWNKNRNRPRPSDYVRVAVIAPGGAAGLGDFRASADRLAAAGLAEFFYHEAPFQTRDAPVRIVEILRGIYRECQADPGHRCAVAMIRGGGASADLAWLVDAKLTEAVCMMNVPVLTGIGHERDRNLLDEVACIPCDTPSKVAEHIATTIVRAATGARDACIAIRTAGLQAVNGHEAGVTSLRHEVHRDASERVRLAEASVRRAASDLEPGAHRLLEETRAGIASAAEDVRTGARERREVAEREVSKLMTDINREAQAGLRPLELGISRAMGDARSRAEGVPPSIDIELARLRCEIVEAAGDLADAAERGARSLQTGMRADAARTLDGCASSIGLIRERADALDPRTVTAAGYAILRDAAGRPLTTVAAVRGAGIIAAELRDGAASLTPVPSQQGEQDVA